MLSRPNVPLSPTSAMRVTYCQDQPKRYICEREEAHLPIAGGYVALSGGRYAIRRVERIAREALAYVMPD